jgi:dTDP-4-amino-4,6-dideoxygalactose transaminase
MTSLTWDRHRGHASGYDVVELGFNYRIDEARAALATARLARLDADNALRAAAVEAYRTGIADLEGLTPTMPPADGGRSAHHLFTVLVAESTDRDAIRADLAEQGVQTSLHYPPIHRFTAYDVDADLPLTEVYAARAITLPLFPTITEEQIGIVLNALGEATHR